MAREVDAVAATPAHGNAIAACGELADVTERQGLVANDNVHGWPHGLPDGAPHAPHQRGRRHRTAVQRPKKKKKKNEEEEEEVVVVVVEDEDEDDDEEEDEEEKENTKEENISI